MNEAVKFFIDGRDCLAEGGSNLLRAALDNGIYIPHLCDIAGNASQASCRLCFVEIEGCPRPVTACTETVREGMVVHTRGRDADRLVRTAFALIMSNHRTGCQSCPANGCCELQRIARERRLPLKPGHFPIIDSDLPLDDSVLGILFDPNKCVLCGSCIKACRENGTGILGFSGRGLARRVSAFEGETLAAGGCSCCGACVSACPSGSFTSRLSGKPVAD